MKTIIIALFLVSTTLLHAKESKIEQILNAYIEAWAEHNISKIDTFYADDVTWYDLGTDSTVQGKAKMTKAITDAFMGYVPDMYWQKNGDLFISGNTITYEWVYGGTFNGKWGNVDVKDKKFSIKGISTTTINKEGKIIFQKDYYDMYGFMKQLGLVKL